MAKKKATAKKTRRESIGFQDFLKVFAPMAKEGKGAEEIGSALGRDATFVSVKASQLRKLAKKQLTAKRLKEHEGDVTDDVLKAIKEGVDKEVLEQIPKLNSRGESAILDLFS